MNNFVIDSHSYSKRYRNQAGYLVLPKCKIAKSGILQYSDVVCDDGSIVADGAIVNVFRPPLALKRSAPQFRQLPLTLTHPNENCVTPESARGETVGALGEPNYFEKEGVGFLESDIIVYDEEAIRSIEEGTTEELSAGYETAYRRKRGIVDGVQYEAEQYYLAPNHVALVENGRCGSECRVCDSKGEQRMKKNQKVRWMLKVGDGDEVVEIPEDLAKKIKKANPEAPVEECSAKDLDDTEGAKKDLDNPDNEADKDKEPEKKKDGDEPDGDEPDGDEPDGEEKKEDADEDPADEDPADGEEPDGEEKKEDAGEDTLIYEVQFDDGTTGKMDENTYKQVKRYMDVTKKGDAAEQTIATISKLTSAATRIIGDSFDVADFVKGNVVDTAEIRRKVIKKVFPELVVKGLVGDSLDRVYQSAVATSKVKKENWERDFQNIQSAADSAVTGNASIVSSARQKYLDRLHGKTEDNK